MILEKFHWTYDYLLWGISWMNVSLMLDDSLRSVDVANKQESRKLETEEDIKKYIQQLNG